MEILWNTVPWAISNHLSSALAIVHWLLTNWSNLFLYLSFIAVLWNRETVIHSTTEGRAGQHNHIFTAVYTVFAVLIFVFGTVGPIVLYVAFQRYDPESEPVQLNYLINISNCLGVYVFGSFVIVTGIVIAISTFLLWRANRAAGITDKITSTMLYVVVPLYATYNLFNIIFTILFYSPKFLLALARSELAGNILLSLSYFAVAVALLFLSVNQDSWKANGITFLPANTPTQTQPTESQQYEQPHTQPLRQPESNLLTTSPSLSSGFMTERRQTDEHVSLQHLAPTRLEISANRLSHETAGKELPSIPAPLSSVAHSRDASVLQPVREPMRQAANAAENESSAELTDEQIDFVSRLSSANVPATDIARLMERMREGRAGSSRRSGGEMSSRTDTTVAPPSYDALEP